MPRYDYLCENGHIFEKFLKMVNSGQDQTCTCGAIAKKTFIVPPSTQLPSVDNQIYNNGQGYFDWGLGKHISTRKEREERMAQLGVMPDNRS